MSPAPKEEPESEPKVEPKPARGGGRKPALLGGGALALVGLAYLVATLAVPTTREVRLFHGPFVAPLTQDKLTVNLRDEGNKRFLVMNLNVVFDAYEQDYVQRRALDPLYVAQLKNALLGLASRRSRTEVLGEASQPIFLEEVRDAVEELVFPVHVGRGASPFQADPESGLAAGRTIEASTFRGPFDLNQLKVDTGARTIAWGDGEPVPYEGHETNLELRSPDGQTLYVDVTGAVPGFEGEVPIGVLGRLRQVLWNEVLVQ